MNERTRFRVSEGMRVRSADGEKLGKVVACDPNGFIVEKGVLFPTDLAVSHERIADVRNGEIFLTLARAEIGERGAHTTGMTASSTVSTASAKAAQNGAGAARAELDLEGRPAGFEQFGKSGEIHIALVEEEVLTSKHVEKVGDVHIRKEVITEEKQISVPVTREVIRVERVAVKQDVPPGEKVFQKESYDFPISEEHVDIEKRAVVREELLVGKEIEQGEETAKATIRRERAEVETKGPVRRVGAAPSTEPAQMRGAGPGAPKR
jgi:uncharacterized protein (TIGR02271 family)